MKQSTIEKLQNLAVSMQLVTVEDMQKHSIPQLVTMIANKMNELIQEVYRFEGDVSDVVKTQNDNIQYLLGEGLHLEVATVFENWMNDGTFDTLINQSAFKKVNDRIDETNAQLTTKAKSSDVVLKGKATLNDFDEGTRALIQGLGSGETNINAVLGDGNIVSDNIDCKAVKMRHLDSIVCGKNKYNHRSSIDGYYVDTNGSIVKDEQFIVSDYILVEPNTRYYKTNERPYALYNRELQCVGGGMSSDITTTADTVYMRISIKKEGDFTKPEKTYLILSSDEKRFEPYYEEFKTPKKLIVTNDDVEDNTLDGKAIRENTISPDKIIGLLPTGNLFLHAEDVIDGRYAYELNGVLSTLANPNYCYFIYEVEANTTYSCTSGRFIVQLSADKKTVLKSLEDRTTFTTVDNACYVAISFNFVTFPKAQYKFVKGNELNVGNTKVYDIEWLAKQETELDIALTKKLTIQKGKEFKLYFKNVIPNYDDYNIECICTKGSQYKDYWVYSSDIAETFTFTINVYKDNVLVAFKTTTISNKDITVPANKTMLFIGDSTTNQEHYPLNFKELTESNITLIGTRGTNVKHEGYSGWTSNALVNTPLQSGVENKFHDGTRFNFSYYMTNNNIGSVDYVTIHLGINDIFGKYTPTSIINNINHMVDSIIEYNNTIKISIVVTIPPTSKDDVFGLVYGCQRPRWMYLNDYFKTVCELIKYFDNDSRVTLIPTHYAMDCDKDYIDAVHPNQSLGYPKMAQTLYSNVF